MKEAYVSNDDLFNADAVRGVAEECLSLARKHGGVLPLLIGHGLLDNEVCLTGGCFCGPALAPALPLRQSRLGDHDEQTPVDRR